MEQSPEEAPIRYGNILLLIPALKGLTQLLIENMTLTKFFGLAEVDSLLSEFILEDGSGIPPLTLQQNIPGSFSSNLSNGDTELLPHTPSNIIGESTFTPANSEPVNDYTYQALPTSDSLLEQQYSPISTGSSGGTQQYPPASSANPDTEGCVMTVL